MKYYQIRPRNGSCQSWNLFFSLIWWASIPKDRTALNRCICCSAAPTLAKQARAAGAKGVSDMTSAGENPSPVSATVHNWEVKLGNCPRSDHFLTQLRYQGHLRYATLIHPSSSSYFNCCWAASSASQTSSSINTLPAHLSRSLGTSWYNNKLEIVHPSTFWFHHRRKLRW